MPRDTRGRTLVCVSKIRRHEVVSYAPNTADYLETLSSHENPVGKSAAYVTRVLTDIDAHDSLQLS